MLHPSRENSDAGCSNRAERARILHIEDDPLAADSVRRIVERWPDCTYAAHAATGSAGIRLAERLRPDLVLLDLGLPDVDGLDVLDALIRLQPRPRVLLLSVRCDDAFLHEVMLGRIEGALTKSARLHLDLREALLACQGGRLYIATEIAEALLRLRRDPRAFFKLLSNREISLLRHFARGDSDHVIAANVGLSPATVHSHRHNITHKLDLHTSAELMRWCAEHGFAHFPRRRTVLESSPGDGTRGRSTATR